MIVGAIIILILIGLDQGLKYMTKALLEGTTEKVIIPKVFTVQYYENTGAAWGMFEGKKVAFFIITIVALIIFGYLYTKIDLNKKKTYSAAMIMLIAGTIGNALDRAILGYVIDFLHLPFLDTVLGWFKISNFYFNIADILLTFGIILLFIDLLILDPIRKKKYERSIHGISENNGEIER